MQPLFRISGVTLLSAALCSCGAVDRIEGIGTAPKMAAVGNPADTQIVAAIPALPPITHEGNSLWQPNAKSFFSDPRASRVGDVITVNVTRDGFRETGKQHLAQPDQQRSGQSDQFLRA